MRKVTGKVILMGCVFMLLTACAGKEAATGITAEETGEAARQSKEETAEAGQEAAVEANPDEALMRKAYQEALTNLVDNHVFPDGTPCDTGADFGEMSENQFAVYDVNGDGNKELILSYSTAPMSGMEAFVCKYDKGTDTLTTQLKEFPAFIFYENGFLRVDWSSNQGHGSDWPFTLYQYDKTEDKYVQIASVDSWDKNIADTNSEGEKFPDDIDTDKTGIVYFVTEGSQETTLGRSDYEAWYDKITEGAAELEVPYEALTKENIAGI